MARAGYTEFEKLLVFRWIEFAEKCCIGYRRLGKGAINLTFLCYESDSQVCPSIGQMLLTPQPVPKHDAPALPNRPVLMSISVGHRTTNERWGCSAYLERVMIVFCRCAISNHVCFVEMTSLSILLALVKSVHEFRDPGKYSR